MIRLQETISSKEEQIQNEISNRKSELIEVLNTTVDRNTNDYFSLDTEEDYSLIFLCREATRIQSLLNINTTFPSQPKEIDSDNIWLKELDIKNKIQYCNNLLRYALKRNGVDPENCNKMEYLIRKLYDIESVIRFDKYISNVSINNRDNLDVLYIEFEDIMSSNVLESFHKDNNNLYIISRPYSHNYNNLFVELDINEEGNLVYKKVKNELSNMGYMEELLDIPVSIMWNDDKNPSSRPTSVTVHLFADNVEKEVITLTQDNWGYTFINYPKYDGEREISYSLTINPVNGYQTTINEFDIILNLI